jgi:hypothetical protein
MGWAAVLRAVRFGLSTRPRDQHPNLKVSRKYHGFELTYVLGPMEEAPGTPTPVPVYPGRPAPREARDRWLVKLIRTTRKDWTEPVRL